MALKGGLHVFYLSDAYTRMSAKSTGPVSPYHCGRHVTCCRRRLNALCFVHIGPRFVPRTLIRRWKQDCLITRCNGMADENQNVQDDGPLGRKGFGRTRLAKIIQEFQKGFSKQSKQLRKNLPMKVFFLLLGFYCASLIVTSVGQTGDWDILSAGLVVAMVEGIGALMYRADALIEKLHSFVTFVNYWKAGLSLGLFLDAFKYEIDEFSMFFDSFKFEVDLSFSSWL